MNIKSTSKGPETHAKVIFLSPILNDPEYNIQLYRVEKSQRITMLERQKYKEFILEQGELESAIAEGWGYNINPQEHVPLPVRPRQTIKVNPIEPMKRPVTLQPSAQLLKIEEELLMLQNQKKLNQLTEQAKAAFERGELQQDNECAAIKMMNQCVDEYNFLLQHRHIIEKNSEKARKIMGIKKSKIQFLKERIDDLKGKLAHSTFAQMIGINKKIAEMYRQYEKNMLSYKETTVKSIRGTSLERSKLRASSMSKSIMLLNTVKLSPDLRTEKRYSMRSSEGNKSRRREKKAELKDFIVLEQLQQLQESSDGNSMCFDRSTINWVEAQMKNQPRSVFIGKANLKMTKKGSLPQTRHRLSTVNEKKSMREQIKERFNTTVTEAFVSKDLLEKGSQLDDHLRQHEDVLEVWKNRIDENRQKNKVTYMRTLPKAKKFRKSLKETAALAVKLNMQEEQEREKMQKAKAVLVYRMQEVKKQMAEKQKIFSTILRKKQNKYKKIPGTQIIKAYNANEEAKIYLGNIDHRRGEVKQRKTVYGTSSFEKEKKEKDVPQWLTIDPDSEELYWSMCRNEKLNLLLKNHKKQ